MLLIGASTHYTWEMQYQSLFYYHDFKTMMSVLEKNYPAYYNYAKKECLNTNMFYRFSGIFNRRDFNKIWDWMQEVLDKCENEIPKRRSTLQNKWRDNLVPFLFTIYIGYWNGRFKYLMVIPFNTDTIEVIENGNDSPDIDAPRGDIIRYLSRLVSEGRVETAVEFSLNGLTGRSDMADVCDIFKEYEKERQFNAMTTLDKVGDFDELIAMGSEIRQATVIKSSKPQMLIVKWTSFGHENMIRSFEHFGFECTCVTIKDTIVRTDLDGCEELDRYMSTGKYDVVYSTDYSEIAAQMCYHHDIPYLAWCYDPLTFNSKHKCLAYPTTNVFLFDSDDLRHYKEAGVEKAYYLPLAADIDYYDGIRCSDEDRARYNAEVSFVGQLYESSLTEAMGYLNDYQKAFMGALIDNQSCVYGYNFIQDVVTDKNIGWMCNAKFADHANEPLKNLLYRQTTNKERLLILTLLAKHHEVKLYADKTSELFKDLKYCGKVDYYEGMPKVFKCSKINLNVTFRAIPNGIPLRCIDIMACGGCLLTNYQKDFEEHFRDGENVLFYRDAGEALEKADFYLAHDTLREKVAMSGYETVKKYYSYPVKIREMLEMAGLHDFVKACGR
jgi:spore maturation protein CgeB